MSRLATLLTLLFLAVAASASAPIVDAGDGFSIVPAEGWVQLPANPKMPYARLKLQSALFPGDPESEGLFYVDIFSATDRSLEKWVAEMRAFVNKEMKGKVLVDDEVTVNGYPGHKILYTGIARGYTERDNGYFRLAILVGDRLYVVHGVATQANFDRHWDDIRAMANSFKLMEPKS